MQRPTVTIVFLVYNRREELRESLRRMLEQSDYDRELVEAIVVDNASSDGSADMVREEFPHVELIVQERNIGAPAWNAGFAAARGDWVLVLDDDCYLPPDGLGKALAAAAEHEADFVSFKVVSTVDPSWVFSDNYRTGLFTFWGCAWLIRTPVVQELRGYDPEIFIWGNELELMLRFFDRGYRHLHLPEVVAQHMKGPDGGPNKIIERGYRINARHWGYVAAKLLRPRDAAEALVALVATAVRDGVRKDSVAFKGIPETVRGFVRGLRQREPLQNAELSRFYRHNFETFASPWWLARPPGELIRALPRESPRQREEGIGRREQYFAERERYYPERAATLDF
jgi:GT2 family glycosyltransferase